MPRGARGRENSVSESTTSSTYPSPTTRRSRCLRRLATRERAGILLPTSPPPERPARATPPPPPPEPPPPAPPPPPRPGRRGAAAGADRASPAGWSHACRHPQAERFQHPCLVYPRHRSNALRTRSARPGASLPPLRLLLHLFTFWPLKLSSPARLRGTERCSVRV